MRASGSRRSQPRRSSGQWEEDEVDEANVATDSDATLFSTGQEPEGSKPLTPRQKAFIKEAEDIIQAKEQREQQQARLTTATGSSAFAVAERASEKVPIIIAKKIGATPTTSPIMARRTSGYIEEIGDVQGPLDGGGRISESSGAEEVEAEDFSGESVAEDELYSGESISEMPDDEFATTQVHSLKDLECSPRQGSFIIAASSSEEVPDDDAMEMLLGGLTHVPKSPRGKPPAAAAPAEDDGDQMIAIPKSSKIAATLRQGAMAALDFSSCEKKEQYGIPSRVQWELWCEILECKLTKQLREAAVAPWQLYVKVEVGRDAHFEVLASHANQEGGAVINFGTESPPRERFTLFHRSRAKCRISVWNKITGGVDQLVADCSYPLKKLESGTARVGWVKLKADVSGINNSKSPRRDSGLKGLGKKSKSPRSALAPKKAKQERELKATVKVGFLLSHSMMASWLFLIDFEAEQVLYYTRVETLADLNPVFHSTERIPFRVSGRLDQRRMAVHWDAPGSPEWLYQVSLLPAGGKALLTDTHSFQCTVELVPASRPQGLCTFTLEGSLRGTVEQASAVPFHRYHVMLEVAEAPRRPDVSEFINNADAAAAQQRKKRAKQLKKHGGKMRVAEAQWRNKRDMKLEIRPDADVDVAALIAVAIALRMLQKQNKQK